MTSDDLSKRITSTYFSLRVGMCIIAFIFPLLLWVGGKIFKHIGLNDTGSMSAYYYAGDGIMRNWFVGILFALGVMLFLYKGITPIEDYVLNVAGGLALSVAVFPMAWCGVDKPLYFSRIHNYCAFLFFLCIGYVCIWHTDTTLKLLPQDAIEKYRKTYKVLGHMMWIFPLTAVGISAVFGFTPWKFYVEVAGVWTFAFYWLVKTREEYRTRADEKAAKGELEAVKKVVVKKMSEETRAMVDLIPQEAPEALGKITIKDQILGNISVREKSPPIP